MPTAFPRVERTTRLQDWGIELRTLKAAGFAPANVVVGVSSEGTVGPLVASQLIRQLEMDQVCALESPMFPPVSVVYYQKPKFPARIYASRRHRLAVVLAEFAPEPELARPLAHAILLWCRRQKAKRILAIEGFPVDPEGAPFGVAAVGGTGSDRATIRGLGLSHLEHGVVTGVAGILLNEARWADHAIIALLAAMGGGASDTQAAIRTLQSIQRLVPKLPLKADAGTWPETDLERAIRQTRERTAHEFI